MLRLATLRAPSGTISLVACIHRRARRGRSARGHRRRSGAGPEVWSRHWSGCVSLPLWGQGLGHGLLDRHHPWPSSTPATRDRPRQGRRQRRREACVACACWSVRGGGRSVGSGLLHAVCVDPGNDLGRYRSARAAARTAVCGSPGETAALGPESTHTAV